LASMRLDNTAGRDAKTNKISVMPIIMVRDPYSWMQRYARHSIQIGANSIKDALSIFSYTSHNAFPSMCKHPYAAMWPHTNRCPHLADKVVPTTMFRSNVGGKHAMVKPQHVDVKYKPTVRFDSLAHFWVQWYKEYLEADYPRLLVRFEDLQFHAKELIDIICQCANGVPRKDDAIFRYVVDSAKWGPAHHDRSTNMVTAMIKYGSDIDRFKGMTEEDKMVASSVLTPELLELFGYEVPDFTATTTVAQS
jgi:hypothetical protein